MVCVCVCVIRKHLVIDTYAGCAWIGIQYLPYAYETEQNEGPMLYGSSWHCIDKTKNTLKCGKRLAIWMFKVEYEWFFNRLLLLRATQLYVLSRQRSIHWMEREKKNGQLQKSCIFCSLKLKWWKRSTVCPWEVKEKEDRQRGEGEREEGEVKREKVSRSWFFFISLGFFFFEKLHFWYILLFLVIAFQYLVVWKTTDRCLTPANRKKMK